MSEDEWVDLANAPLIADVTWLHAQNGQPEPQEDSWLPRSLADVSDTPPDPPTLGGLNLVYHGKRHLFSGPQESAKTLAAYVVALSVVREGGRVMLIDFEMGDRDAKRRLRELGATDADLAMFDYIEPEVPLTEPKTTELVAREPQLVIIDASAGAYDLQGLDDNKRQDVERFASLYVRPFWRSDIATLTIDHVVKNVEARGNYAIGSERKAGGTDVHLGFTVLSPIKRGTSGKYQITTHKDRGGFHKRGKLATFELSSDPDTHHFTWAFVAAAQTDEEHPFRPTIKMEQASRWLEKQSEPVPIGQVEDGVGGNRDAFREAMSLLIEEGWVSETKGSRGARLLEVVRVYRESSDDLAPTSPDLAQIAGLSDLASSPNPLQGGRGAGEDDGRWANSPETLGEDDDGIPF